jgi:nitroreductase
VRTRLDFDRPVERAVVEECLELAFQAPTGSNLQTWDWAWSRTRLAAPQWLRCT